MRLAYRILMVFMPSVSFKFEGTTHHVALDKIINIGIAAHIKTLSEQKKRKLRQEETRRKKKQAGKS